MSKDYSISALIADFFCHAAFPVTIQLNIPAYIFYTSGAGSLSLFLYFPTVHRITTGNLKDISTHFDVPGIPSILSTDMPKPLLERHDKAYEYFVESSTGWSKSAGIVVNTYESLEPTAIKAIRNGLSVPDGRTPPIYCIGPLISSDDRSGGDGVPECLTWLDSQPSQSVVFLCFGSLGLFSIEQLKEIATGLEKSGQRFLWVVRNPPSKNENVARFAQPDPDLDSLLPDGFLDRTRERGLVLKSWAPQVAVLNHDSVGGFVTHCGWNSVLEALCAGIPMVAWPLYAEQRVNRLVLVEDIKIALPMTESENGFVSSAEVEKRVRELMESEKGNSVRKRIVELKNEAKAAPSEGGSSRIGLMEFVESWQRKPR